MRLSQTVMSGLLRIGTLTKCSLRKHVAQHLRPASSVGSSGVWLRPSRFWTNVIMKGSPTARSDDTASGERERLLPTSGRSGQSAASRSVSGAANLDSKATEDRSFPQHPRVGIGAVVLRKAAPPATGSEVLLVRRAKPPSQGYWSFPGGGLELAESIVDCAVREVAEETGVKLVNGNCSPDGLYGRNANTLESPMPFAAADVVARDDDGRVKYHYAIIEVAARPVDPQQPLQPADDVSAAEWFPIDALPTLEDLTVNCASIAKEADLRFKLP